MLEVVTFPHSSLNTRALEVQSFNDDLQALVSEMIDVMYASGGVGLAAPQVGVSQRVVVIDPSAGEDSNQLIKMINPRVTWVSPDTDTSEEGCLSLPGAVVSVTRPRAVNIEYHDLAGKVQMLECTGFQARVVQHEIDHLDGLTMLDKAGPVARKLALKGMNR